MAKKYKIGQKVNGKVLKLNPFGAFVELDKEIHGLIHITELMAEKEKGNKELEAGQAYDFYVISIEPTEHRLGLSLNKPSAKKPVEDSSSAKATEDKKKESKTEDLRPKTEDQDKKEDKPKEEAKTENSKLKTKNEEIKEEKKEEKKDEEVKKEKTEKKDK